MLFPASEHAANHPDTWKVVKIADRLWALQTKDGGTIETLPTRRECEAMKTEGFLFRLYHDEVAWMAGEPRRGWRPYAEVEAERAALAARRANA